MIYKNIPFRTALKTDNIKYGKKGSKYTSMVVIKNGTAL